MNVWYVSYGFNLSQKRFSCYIEGGIPEGSEKEERGCKNTAPPKKIKKAMLPYPLYFMKEKSKWGKGGVAFISPRQCKDSKTYARRYLITDEQFREVVEQENNADSLNINVHDIIDKGYLDVTEGWYGRILYLGKEEGAPMFTFTNPDAMGTHAFTIPPPAYLSMISHGLKEIGLAKEEIAKYLLTKPGIDGKFTKDSLFRYIFR
ncbi:hypothetical protein [Oceanobacillus sp. CFH 90083]|uniref:hypothetical protein n=1 Tax=Oceanobacillus sp. CFH 90083 TaxID=2592336 RepID=UPI00128C1C24|nr:hypothetical protein [Oceanobacillus sp. CFH 90083]